MLVTRGPCNTKHSNSWVNCIDAEEGSVDTSVRNQEICGAAATLSESSAIIVHASGKAFAASPPVFTIADRNWNEVQIACRRQPEG